MQKGDAVNRPVTISVLITNYNYARFIAKALDSVIKQTASPLEILVYDDGSTDNSLEIIREYPARLFSGPNRGVAHARNRLMERARGTHLIFLDGDDWLAPEALETAGRKIEAEAATRATYCEFRFHREDGAATIPRPHRRTPPVLTADTCYKVLHYMPCHTIVFPAAWKIPFDESLSTSEDQAFWAELLLRGARFSYIPDVLSVYRIHGKSRSYDRRLRSLQNQTSIHVNLISRHPSANRCVSFLRHVRWRRYKYAVELFRQGRKSEAAGEVIGSIRSIRDDIPQRLAMLLLGYCLPASFLRGLTRKIEGFKRT